MNHTKEHRKLLSVYGLVALLAFFFMSTMTVKAIVNKTVTLRDLFTVLFLWVSAELVWSLLKAVAAWARGR